MCMHVKLEAGHVEIVRKLHEAGANSHIVSVDKGWTPLQAARLEWSDQGRRIAAKDRLGPDRRLCAKAHGIFEVEAGNCWRSRRLS